MNSRVSAAAAEALRLKAAGEGRSIPEVDAPAVAAYASERSGRLRVAIERVRTEDPELLDRLSW